MSELQKQAIAFINKYPNAIHQSARVYAQRELGLQAEDQIKEFVDEWWNLKISAAEFARDVSRIWPEEKYG